MKMKWSAIIMATVIGLGWFTPTSHAANSSSGNGVGVVSPPIASRVGMGGGKEVVRGSAEEYLKAAWAAVTRAQQAEKMDPYQAETAWMTAVQEAEAMLRHHPNWVRRARAQAAQAAQAEDLPSASEVAELKPIFQKYWALYHIGTAQFIRAMGYSHLGFPKKAQEAAREIVTHYTWAQAWDPHGWFWQVERALETDYPELYQAALQTPRELPPAVSVPRVFPVKRSLVIQQQPAVLAPSPPPPTVAEIPHPASTPLPPQLPSPKVLQPSPSTAPTWWLLSAILLGVSTLGVVGWWLFRGQERFVGGTPPLTPKEAPSGSLEAFRSPTLVAPPETVDLVQVIREAQYFAKPERAFAVWIHRHGGATAKQWVLKLSEAEQLTALERAGYQWIAAQLRKIHRRYPTLYFETLARSLQAFPRCRTILGDDYPRWLKAFLEVTASESPMADEELTTVVSTIAQDTSLDHAIRHLALETLIRLGKKVTTEELEAVSLPEPAQDLVPPLQTPKAIAKCIQALRHPNEEVANEAYQRLAAVNRPLIRRQLLQAFSTAAQPIAQRLVQLLTSYGPSAIPELVGALGHPNESVRLAAQELLAQLKDRAFADLAIAIRQPEQGRAVRLNAARVLNRLYPTSRQQWEIREALLAVSEDPDLILQHLARRFLQQIGQPS
ncbi:MAG: hypothetical protein HYZ73_00530 [Elusimicrobia bacterium]|nr:hypothetical protein [Elusimicrobiota bacterium]